MIPATPHDDAYNVFMTLPHYTHTRKHPVPPVAREGAIKEMKAVAVFPRTREIKFTGVPSLKAPIEIDADLLMHNIVLKNQIIFGTVNASPEDFDAAIKDIGVFNRRWPHALSAFITSRRPPEEAPGLLQSRFDGVKNVITFDKATVPPSGGVTRESTLHHP